MEMGGCCTGNISQFSKMFSSQSWVLLVPQAATETARPTCTSAAAVSVWTPAWCVTASPTVPTVRTRAQDALNATAPAYRLLAASPAASARRTARSVRTAFADWPAEIPSSAVSHQSSLFCRGASVLQVSDGTPVPSPAWTSTSALKRRTPSANMPAWTPQGPTSVAALLTSTWSLTTKAARPEVPSLPHVARLSAQRYETSAPLWVELKKCSALVSNLAWTKMCRKMSIPN